MAVEKFANNASTTINQGGGIAAGDTSVIVTSASSFPSSGNFRILIDSEIILVTAVATNTFTISRAQESTTAASHSNGATVTQILTSGGLSQFRKDVANNVGLASARPTAVGSGALYFCSDLPVVYVDDPTAVAWKQFATSIQLAIPPLASSYTQQGSGMLLVQRADAILAINTNTTYNCAFQSGTLTNTATWIVSACIQYSISQTAGTFPNAGVLVSTGTTTSSTGYGLAVYNSAATSISLHNETFTVGTTSRSATGTENAPMTALNGLIWLRILNDGATTYFQMSGNGLYWQNWATTTALTSLTNWGFFMGASAGSGTGVGTAIVLSNTMTTGLTVPQSTVSGATNANPIVITATAHGLQTGDQVRVQNVGGNTNANTTTFINVLTANTFQMLGIAGNSAYTSGGTVSLLNR